MSGGEGKTRVLDEKATTLYKRALDMSYHLKIKASRTVFNEITTRFPTMPFTLRALPGRETRLGLHECLNHNLLHPYPVLHEKARPGQVPPFCVTIPAPCCVSTLSFGSPGSVTSSPREVYY